MKKYVALGVVLICLVTLPFVFKHKKVAVTTPPTESYVALGDSVAAGVGLKTDSDSSACNRTNQSYPNLVAQQLNLQLHSLACSGATLTQGVLGKQDVNQLWLRPQIDQLFKMPKPDLISLTIGANDVDWTAIIGKCYQSECGTNMDNLFVDQKISVLNKNLHSALKQMQDHYKKSLPRVIVTGYHQVFPSTASKCADLTNINQNELNWGRQQQAKLNNAIKNIVKDFGFAKFAPVDYSGHELCTSDQWVQGINDKQPYHPTDMGQTVYSNEVVKVAREFK